MINAILRFFGLHDYNGLKYSIDHLNKIGREIVFYPIDKQAKYADQICVENVRDPLFNHNILLELNEVSFEGVNATSVGNIAYIALNSPNQKVRAKCKEWLGRYKRHIEAN